MLKEKMEGEKHMYIIAGLGNPTMQYEGTRHNAGFDVIDALADKYNISVDGRKNRAYIGKGIIRRTESTPCKTADLHESER